MEEPTEDVPPPPPDPPAPDPPVPPNPPVPRGPRAPQAGQAPRQNDLFQKEDICDVLPEAGVGKVKPYIDCGGTRWHIKYRKRPGESPWTVSKSFKEALNFEGDARIEGQRDSLKPVLRSTWDEWYREEHEACPFDIDERVDQLSPA